VTTVARPGGEPADRASRPAVLGAVAVVAAFWFAWSLARLLFVTVPAWLIGIEVPLGPALAKFWGVWGIATTGAELALGALSLALQAVAAASAKGRPWWFAASLVAMAACAGPGRFSAGANVPLTLVVVALVGLGPGLAGVAARNWLERRG
jgi:hypothetical protein